MKIDWDIDLSEEDGDGDGDNCLGMIRINDENGNSICDDLTYIDSWLAGLGDSVIQLQRDGGDIKIDLLVEPDELVISRLAKGFGLSYKNQIVFISTFSEYKDCIEDAIQRFVNVCMGDSECSSLIVEELEVMLKQFKGRV